MASLPRRPRSHPAGSKKIDGMNQETPQAEEERTDMRRDKDLKLKLAITMLVSLGVIGMTFALTIIFGPTADVGSTPPPAHPNMDLFMEKISVAMGSRSPKALTHWTADSLTRFFIEDVEAAQYLFDKKVKVTGEVNFVSIRRDRRGRTEAVTVMLAKDDSGYGDPCAWMVIEVQDWPEAMALKEGDITTISGVVDRVWRNNICLKNARLRR